MQDKLFVTAPSLAPLKEYLDLLEGIWSRGILTHNGPLVQELEFRLNCALSVQNLRLVTNGTMALQMAIKALDLKGEIINIGSNNTYSINHLVELLGGDKTYIPKGPGEPDCTWADISKATQLLNWEPKVSLEAGVKVLLDDMAYWKDAPIWDEKSIARATEQWFEYLR